MKKVMERVQIKMEQRTRTLVGEGLYDKNLVKAINCRVIPVSAYMMNICNFTGKELDQLDQGIKKILRENKMHGKQCSDERSNLRRELGGRGIKSLKDVYAENGNKSIIINKERGTVYKDFHFDSTELFSEYTSNITYFQTLVQGASDVFYF